MKARWGKVTIGQIAGEIVAELGRTRLHTSIPLTRQFQRKPLLFASPKSFNNPFSRDEQSILMLCYRTRRAALAIFVCANSLDTGVPHLVKRIATIAPAIGGIDRGSVALRQLTSGVTRHRFLELLFSFLHDRANLPRVFFAFLSQFGNHG